MKNEIRYLRIDNNWIISDKIKYFWLKLNPNINTLNLINDKEYIKDNIVLWDWILEIKDKYDKLDYKTWFCFNNKLWTDMFIIKNKKLTEDFIDNLI